jgi:hypothetical protein
MKTLAIAALVLLGLVALVVLQAFWHAFAPELLRRLRGGRGKT